MIHHLDNSENVGPKSEDAELNIEPSAHAREQASARQRRREDES